MSWLAFAHPAWLLAAIALVAIAELVRRRRRPDPALPFAFGRLLTGLPRSWRVRALAWLPRLRLLLLLLIALAVAAPSLSWRAQQETRRGVDLLIALDSSSSMTLVLPGAFASTRFDAARSAAREFARRRPQDRVGLVTFARFPRLVVPLTWDHELFDQLLADVVPVAAGSEEDRTAIGVALADGADRLSDSLDHARALVLITDGANNETRIEPEAGLRGCQEAQVRVYTIAFAADARFGGGTAPPDLGMLQQIAAATGGHAFEAQDRAALDDACRSIDQLEPATIALTSGLRAWPLASPLLAIALVAWIALGLLEHGCVRSVP